ncbi:hypothetical protein LCGC14_3109170, partial [marine sediment metagenome]
MVGKRVAEQRFHQAVDVVALGLCVNLQIKKNDIHNFSTTTAMANGEAAA